MINRIIISTPRQSIINTHTVLRNTYFLLSLTLIFSAIIATLSTTYHLPYPGFIPMLIGFYGLMFLTYRLANRSSGILAIFAFTGFVGYCLGPFLNSFLSTGGRTNSDIVMALGGTALVFFCCSTYVLTTRRNMSFLSGMLMAGFIVLLMSSVANFFIQLPAFHLAVSSLFIIFSTGSILWEISNIIHNGETNYIRATISLYVSLYNIFVSFLSFTSKD